MANKKTQDLGLVQMFGLTYEQSNLLFSTQYKLTRLDITNEKNEEKKKVKTKWLDEWKEGITAFLSSQESSNISELIPIPNLDKYFIDELQKSNNRTWYYILILECITFTPYTRLGNENRDKEYSKCKYNSKATYDNIKSFFSKQGVLSTDTIDRLHQTYKKSINQITGKAGKIAVRILSIVAIATIAAAAAAIFAGPIAVAIFGSQFPGLSGAALTSACLAMAGGGAIAAGGAGMAGGVAVIAGGGGLLGLAGGGAGSAFLSKIVKSSPEYALTQSAKLETILKEVILNAQYDVASAQKVIAQLQDQIKELNDELTKLQIENEKNKKEIKNIKESIKYMTKACKEMNIFTSSFDTGMKAAGDS